MDDYIIVGGGIIGMMTARTLVMSGATVSILDRRECGKESSWSGGGIISPLYPWDYDDIINDLSFASQAIYANLCADIYKNTGIDPQYVLSGLLMIDKYRSVTALKWMKKYNISYQNHAQGALFSHIAQVRNPRLLKALKADIISKGVKIIEHVKVTNVLTSNNKAIGVNTKQKRYTSGNVIVCSGAWSSQWLNLKEKIFPIKGQMIIIKPKVNVLNNIILDQGRYIIPRTDGQLLVGSTMENVGFDNSLSANTKQSLFKFAYQKFPDLTQTDIKHHWSGFRPANTSNKVLLGKHHKFNHLFINTGHFCNGLNTAPASADRIKQLIFNE